MKPQSALARAVALAVLAGGAILCHSDAAAEPSKNLRETFGASPSLPGPDIPAGNARELIGVNELSGTPAATVPFELLRARGSVQPSLALHYVPGADGEAGRGWTLSLPTVERKPLFGLPRYEFDPTPTSWPSPDKTDRFQFAGADLVPLGTVSGGACAAVPGETFSSELEGWRYFRLLVDQSLRRFFWSPDRLTWRIEDPSGAVMELGVPRSELSYDTAVDREPGQAPFRWNLVRQWDAHGEQTNPIVYRWRKFSVAQDSTTQPTRGYLTDIFDTPPARRGDSPALSDWAHHVRLDWDEQPFRVDSGPDTMFRWHDHRLVLVTVLSKDFAATAPRSEVRMYGLEYADAPSGSASRLNSSYLSAVIPRAMAPLGTCVENPDFSVPLGCPARALPGEAFTYEGINAEGSAHACETSEFSGVAAPIFSGVTSGILEDASLFSATVVNGPDDGLVDVYVPAHANKEPVGLANDVPASGGLVAGTSAVDGPFYFGASGRVRAPDFLSPQTFNVVGDWGWDGANVLFGFGSGDTKLADPAGAAASAAGYMLFRPTAPKGPGAFGWTEVVENAPGAQACVSSSQCASGICSGGACGCNVDADCPAGLTCDAAGQTCVVFTGSLFGDVNHDGLVDEIGAAASPQSGGVRESVRDPARGRVLPFTTLLPGNEFVGIPHEALGQALVDVDGDGLADLVQHVGCGAIAKKGDLYACDVQYRPGDGRGSFDSVFPFRQMDTVQLHMTGFKNGGADVLPVSLHDVNGDGLADLVVYGSDAVAVFFNRDGTHWMPGGQLQIVNDGLGSRPFAKGVYGDVDGDGLDDVVLFSIGDVKGGSQFNADAIAYARTRPCGRLVTASTDYGAEARVHYDTLANLEQKSGTSHGSSPIPVNVVTGVDYSVPGGAPSQWSKSYFYDDPVYDPWRRTFRGFKATRVRTGWNEAFADVTSGHVRATHHIQRRTEYLLEGCSLSQATHATEMDPEGHPVLCNPDSDEPRQRPALPIVVDDFGDATQSADLGNPSPFVATPGSTYRSTTVLGYSEVDYATGLDGRVVQQVLRDQVDTYLYDDAPFLAQDQAPADTPVLCVLGQSGRPVCETAPVTIHSPNYAHLRRESSHDRFGNVVLDLDLGLVDASGNPADPDDPPIARVYVPSQVGPDWTWRRSDVTIDGQKTIGKVTDPNRHLHFEWSFGGDLTRISGDLTGTVALDRFHQNPMKPVAPAPSFQSADAAGVELGRFLVDGFGNVVQATGPSGRCTAFGFDGRYEQLPTSTTTYVDGCGGAEALVTSQALSREFATPTMTVDASGAVALVKLDDRGRVVGLSQPDPAALGLTIPSVTVDYHGDAPVGPFHWVRVTGPGSDAYIYLDASGRQAFALDRADKAAGDGGDWILTGNHFVDDDQELVAYQASYFQGAPAAVNGPPGATSSFTERTSLDEYFRPVAEHAFDGTVVQQSKYHALAVDQTSEGGNQSSVDRNGHGRIATTHRRVGGDDLELHFRYTSIGEPAEIQQTHGANPADAVTRWMQYDSLGRLVENLEPNTTDGLHDWKYAYDDGGDLVGTSDARGCGENLFYDGAGRLTAEDYSPCLDSQEDYTAPNANLANGTEARYTYDSAGRLKTAIDRGAADGFRFDARGRTVAVERLVARPGATPYALSDRYVHHVSEVATAYDDANRVVSASTGADVTELLGAGSSSTVAFHYTQRGVVGSVTSDYDGARGPLLGDLTYEVDGLPSHSQFSDQAATQGDETYDARRRPKTATLARGPSSGWATPVTGYTPPPASPPSTLQTILDDTTFGYDADGNLQTLADHRDPAEWASGAKPSSRAMVYDEARRMTSVAYAYPGGADSQSPVFTQAELSALPASSLADRVGQQSYAYDWRGNITQATDDATAFFDRSTGSRTFGATAPHQLVSATSTTGTLSAQYDATGNLVNLVVQRQGDCAGPVGKCAQRFVYDWDEVGQLARARRWDYAALPANDPPYPQVPAEAPAANLSFKYHQNQRILESSVDAGGGITYDVDVFDSLRLDGTTWDAVAVDYVRDASVESIYLAGIAHVVFDASLPRRDGTGQHVFYETADQVGSTSVVFDRNTGELVERVTNQAYGATDSDDRPDRWSHFRERRRLSGHVDDVELGLVYFGARYYSPNLQQWLSADPLTVHGLGSSFNPYSYVSGSPAQAVDAVGLCEDPNDPSCGGAGSTWNPLEGFGEVIGSQICNLFHCDGGSSGGQGGGGQVASGSLAAPPPPPPPPPPGTPVPGNAGAGSTLAQSGWQFTVGLVDGAFHVTPSGWLEGAALQAALNLLESTGSGSSSSTLRVAVRHVARSIARATAPPAPSAPWAVRAARAIGEATPNLTLAVFTAGLASPEVLASDGATVVADDAVAAEGFEAIGSTGRVGEQALQQLGGESQVFFRTSQGGRFVDQLVDGVAHESKVGYQSLTPTIARQIAKDAELLQTGQVSGYTWHFFESPVTGLGGPSGPLLNQLQQAGINVVLHF